MAAEPGGSRPPALLVSLAGVLVDAAGRVRPEVEALIDEVRAAGRPVGILAAATGRMRAPAPAVLGRVDAVVDVVVDAPGDGAPPTAGSVGGGAAGGGPVRGGPAPAAGAGGTAASRPSPARGVHERAATALHRAPLEVVFVGAVVADVEAAVAAGGRAVWFDAADVPDSVRRVHDALGLHGHAGGAHPAG